MTAEEAILTLLRQRGAGKTICPSEAARMIAGRDGDWRANMVSVHKAVDELLERGRVVLSWKDEPLRDRAGPYRIGMPE